jgi:hypothetical protein
MVSAILGSSAAVARVGRRSVSAPGLVITAQPRSGLPPLFVSPAANGPELVDIAQKAAGPFCQFLVLVFEYD